MHLGELIGRLRDGGLDPTAEEVADAVWLAQWLPHASPPGERGAPSATAPPRPDDTREPVGESAAGAAAEAPEPPPRAAASADVPLHLPGGTADSGDAGPGLPVRAPAAAALPGLLGLQQALRPLRRYAPYPVRPVDGSLDEDATAERSAATGLLIPVLRAARRRSVDVQLLMDTGPAMAVWERMVEELRQACEQSGVFRDVQVHQLYDNGDGIPLVGTTTGPHSRTRLRTADQLHDPAGRRLTLVVSDCVGPLWQSGAAQRLLRSWPGGSPIAVVQPLPSRLWARTALPAEPGLLTRTPQPGGRTVFDPDDEPWEPRPPGAKAVPVLQPTPEAFAAWARLLAGQGGPVRGWAAWVSRASDGSGAPLAPVPPAGRSDDELLRAFRATASPGALRLAVCLAAAPLSLPVMQLVQRTMLPDTGPMELAEVLLGGLLRQLPGTEARPCFVYPARVQELLLSSLDRAAAGLVLKHCSAYVERHFDRGTRNFAALAAARIAGHDEENEQVRAPDAASGADEDTPDTTTAGVESELFATVPARVLRFYQPDLVAAEPLLEAERLLARWHDQADPSVLLRARTQAEAALRGGGITQDADSGVRARLVLGRVLRAESGTARVRGTERRLTLLHEAAAVLDEALRTATEGSAAHADAALELAAVHDELWRATQDTHFLQRALAALPGSAAQWPADRRRALLLRRGRLLFADGNPAAAARELRLACDLLDAEGAPDSVRCPALLDLAEALRVVDTPEATAAVFARAEEAAGTDPALRLRCLSAQAAFHEATGDHQNADRAYEAAARLAPPDSARRSGLLTVWGESLLRRAAADTGAAIVDRAENVLREALTALPARAPDRGRLLGLVGSALAQRFRHLGFLPDLFESRHLLGQAIRGARDARVRAEGRLQLGRVIVELRRRTGTPVLAEALQAYEHAEQEARIAYGRAPGSVTAARALHGQGGVLELMGRSAAARTAYRSAADEWRQLTGVLREVDWQEVELTRARAAAVDADELALPGVDRLSAEDWDRASPPWCTWGGVRAVVTA
ncbi:SAV_2336 N-terminal domain-related protein [Streptomyces sp. MZ04]|uniref:SAV_2336 N-terminal domain-related protein n=1 Tax=Streptomyces sp. MZ04 TaxID=2559236 RepID=UPI001FD7516B|nr:SAV_2336 N-terminal domain-related protein [Streptomyces sp. MZ04]